MMGRVGIPVGLGKGGRNQECAHSPGFIGKIMKSKQRREYAKH
jgi:hypothetical protein